MRPTVLFASAQTFEAGDQLAAALRRRGVRVELFRPPAEGGFARILLRAGRLVYTRIHESSAQTGADAISVRELAERAAEPDVVSVEATDETVAPLVQFLTGSSSTDLSPAQEAVLPKVCSANHPAGMFDKRWQAEAAEKAGLTPPKTWSDLADVDTFPILVKPILGGGGEGIKLARSRVDLEEIIAAQASTDEPTYAQQFVTGRTIQVGGVAKAGIPIVISAYVGDPYPDSPFGQIGTFRLLDLPKEEAAVAALLEDTGYTGAFCVDLIQNETGQSWFLELNARIFGSWMGLQLAGVNFVGAYQYAFDIGEKPTESPRDYTTTFNLKHPDTHKPLPLAKAGLGRARTMARTIGIRGVALMTSDLLAHIRRIRSEGAKPAESTVPASPANRDARDVSE